MEENYLLFLLAFYRKYFELSKGGILAFPDKRNNNLSLLFGDASGGVVGSSRNVVLLNRTGVLFRAHRLEGWGVCGRTLSVLEGWPWASSIAGESVTSVGSQAPAQTRIGGCVYQGPRRSVSTFKSEKQSHISQLSLQQEPPGCLFKTDSNSNS